MRVRVLSACAALLACLAAGLGAAPRPLVAVLGTCSALATDTYPNDTQNWFDAGRSPQVVFYAHLLFPVAPLPEESEPDLPGEPWHPPMAAAPAPGSTATARAQDDAHYAEAEWLDPDGTRIADYGMTFTARARADWIAVDGRQYIPHTFAMAIGTRDLRAGAGQTRLPAAEGEYTVRLRVDGRSVGLAFYRMLHSSQAPAPKPSAAAPGAAGAVRPAPTAGAAGSEAAPKSVAIPILAPLRLP